MCISFVSEEAQEPGGATHGGRGHGDAVCNGGWVGTEVDEVEESVYRAHVDEQSGSERRIGKSRQIRGCINGQRNWSRWSRWSDLANLFIDAAADRPLDSLHDIAWEAQSLKRNFARHACISAQLESMDKQKSKESS